MQSPIYFLLAIVSLAIGLIGWRYIHLAKRTKQQQQKSKQSYVKENIKQFGANNRGTSMDKQNIFVVSPSDLGI